MVATLHPQVATITPQYAVPFTLSCAAGRPALVEQTAAVLVIPSLDCVTNGVPLVSFLFFPVCFCSVLLVFSLKTQKNQNQEPSLALQRAWEHVPSRGCVLAASVMSHCFLPTFAEVLFDSEDQCGSSLQAQCGQSSLCSCR